jgi:hypothetical protein
MAAQSTTEVHLSATEGVKTGTLVGSLADPRGQKVYAGRAAVFLCDAQSGLPINRETKKVILPSLHDPQLDKLWYTNTNERGYFEFKDVPVGNYRLVAQSWSGTQGFEGFGADKHPSAFVILHGVATNVEVQDNQQTAAYPRQLGNHVLQIMNDPEEPHALLLISLQPTLGDGILGPYGWGKKFCQQLIGFTQMEVGYVTIVGLPGDAAIHVGLMNYDNNPGVGAASFQAGQREGTLRIIASWSNAHKDPPPELEKLTNHLADNNISVEAILKQIGIEDKDQIGADRVMLQLLNQDNDYQVEIAGLGQQRLADVMAAFAYIRMRNDKR